MRQMKKIARNASTVAAVIAVVSTASCSLWSLWMSHVEEPAYQVLVSEKTNDIEQRYYGPMLVALVELEGERTQAIRDGFRILADYIFGNNTAQQSIAMTAPVAQQAGQQIAMTAPVAQQATAEGWQVSFVMPSQYTVATLPKPNNLQVTIRELPAMRYAVIRFSGSNTDANIAEHTELLRNYMLIEGLEPLSQPKYAFYNPPWTLPFLRRNEILVVIR